MAVILSAPSFYYQLSAVFCGSDSFQAKFIHYAVLSQIYGATKEMNADENWREKSTFSVGRGSLWPE